MALVLLPPAVGLAGFLVPADNERPRGAAAAREVLRGYLLVPVIAGILIFLALVGVGRKVRSARHGWSVVHVPIVVKAGGYEEVLADLRDALASADLPTTAADAPWVLTLPAQILTKVAGGNVRKLRPDRLVELTAPGLQVGVYPSDIVIAGDTHTRTRARAAIMSRLATTSAHLTTSAKAQAAEDRIHRIANMHRGSGRTAGGTGYDTFGAIDTLLLDLAIPVDEWDILFRLRLQVERDILAGTRPGTAFPGEAADARRPARLAPPRDRARRPPTPRAATSSAGGRP